MTSRFVLATANPHKAEEIAEIVGPSLILEPRPGWVPEVDESGATLVENARLKAHAVCRATGIPALADDTGLEVEALGGAPGVWSARYAGPNCDPAENIALLLSELKGRDGAVQRAARFRTVAVAAWPDGSELIAEGQVEGWIAQTLSGVGGFGYDPVFIPTEGDGSTFGDLVARDPEEKHRLSHRGRAFRLLCEMIAESQAS